ncbi:hypothetical protein ACQ4PT_052823 [Festuca glaucescens]
MFNLIPEDWGGSASPWIRELSVSIDRCSGFSTISLALIARSCRRNRGSGSRPLTFGHPIFLKGRNGLVVGAVTFVSPSDVMIGMANTEGGFGCVLTITTSLGSNSTLPFMNSSLST